MTLTPALSRRLSGRIAYLAEGGGQVGIEHFDLSSHPGGHVLRALCVLDDARLLRDVTLALDRAWRPLDGFCRLTRDGVMEAALWFDVGADAVRVEGRVGAQSLAGQTIATEGRLAYLGLHPLQGDALIVAVRGTADPGAYVAIDAVTNSISPNGDEAVGACPVRIDVAYVGATDVTVRAGRFAARHYRLRWRADWPAADLWVRREDCLFLRMTWAQVPTTYELIDFEERRYA